MVGYWAEGRIFGGVVLFDRRDPERDPEADPDAIYLHPDRWKVTYRIFQLLPEQRSALLDFLLGDTAPASGGPLPILGTSANRVRVDPEEPIGETGIYRDLWERKWHPQGESDSRLRDVISRLDYPTMEDRGAAVTRAWAMRERWREQEMEKDESEAEREAKEWEEVERKIAEWEAKEKEEVEKEEAEKEEVEREEAERKGAEKGKAEEGVEEEVEEGRRGKKRKRRWMGMGERWWRVKSGVYDNRHGLKDP